MIFNQISICTEQYNDDTLFGYPLPKDISKIIYIFKHQYLYVYAASKNLSNQWKWKYFNSTLLKMYLLSVEVFDSKLDLRTPCTFIISGIWGSSMMWFCHKRQALPALHNTTALSSHFSCDEMFVHKAVFMTFFQPSEFYQP